MKSLKVVQFFISNTISLVQNASKIAQNGLNLTFYLPLVQDIAVKRIKFGSSEAFFTFLCSLKLYFWKSGKLELEAMKKARDTLTQRKLDYSASNMVICVLLANKEASRSVTTKRRVSATKNIDDL